MNISTLKIIILVLLFPTFLFSSIKKGSDDFVFSEAGVTSERPVRIYYHRPKKLDEDSSVMFILHGSSRNAEDYRDTWVSYADETNTLIIAPEFSDRYYRYSSSYNEGSVYDYKTKHFNPREYWVYGVIDEIFDRVVDELGLNARSYDIYGHSAGSQFVHRLCFFNPDAKIRKAFAANAGRYIFPDKKAKYPNGFMGVPDANTYIMSGFAKKLVIVLGDEDDNSHDGGLRNDRETRKQGNDRFERGHNFLEASKQKSRKMNISLNWEILVVEDVAHSRSGTSRAVMAYLREELGID